MAKNGILGILRGPFGTTGENRNDYPCSVTAWQNAFNDEMWKEKIKNGGVLGRLDHCNESQDNPADETLMKEACIVVKSTPIIDGKGLVIGEAHILDNDAGRVVYTLAKAGIKPGISFRGGINQSLAEAGDEEGAWNEFTIDGFDIVYVPAYKEARLQLVEDYGAVAASATLRSNVMKVCASMKGESKAKIMSAVRAATSPSDIKNINKEISSASPEAKKDIAEKAKQLVKDPKFSPQALAPKQDGNMGAEPRVEDGEEKEEVITGKKIQILDKNNGEGETQPLESKKASIEKDLQNITVNAISNAVEDAKKSLPATASGKAEKKANRNVQADATDEPDIQKVDNTNLDGIQVDTGEGNANPAEINGTPEEVLKTEVQKLAETNATLESLVTELKERLECGNAEKEAITAKFKRQKQTLAHYVDKCASLEASSNQAWTALKQTKKVNAEANKMQTAQINDLKEVVASLEKDLSNNNRVMAVRANAFKKVEMEKSVLASRQGGDIAGRMAFIELANVYGVSPERLLAQRASIKSSSDLNRVIASLQKANVNTRVRASYKGQSGVLENTMPDEMFDDYAFALDVDL